MRKKTITIVIIIILILSSIIVTKIYADDPSSTVVSIPNTTLKPGDQMKVYINIENITTYTLSQIVLTTDIYLEPVIDVATTGMTISDSTFDPLNKTFTIQNIPAGVNTICVSYTIPSYIASGTPINVTYALSDDQGTQQEGNSIQVMVVSDNTTNQNTTNNTGTGGTSGEGGNSGATGAGGTGSQQQNTPSGQNTTNNSTKNNMNSGANNTRSSSGNSSSSTSRSQSIGTGASNFSGSGASSVQTVTYPGSRDNYLSNLTVKGYSLTPKFNKTNNTYFVTVSNGVKSVTVTATKEDSTAVVTISGNTNLQVGLNKVLISVLAQNGDVRYYRIYVTRD